MLTRWRDQADLVIRNVWDSLVLVIIARRILSKISIIPNESRQGTYDFNTSSEVLVVKSSAVLFKAWISERERSVRSSFGTHALARLNAATAPALADARLKS